MINLNSGQRRYLRSLAHSLSPVVMIGGAGLTDAVVAEADRALKAHELIKVKVAGDDRALREAIFNEMAERLAAAPVQHIGKTLVFYRPAEKPEITLPRD